ncbi:MAG: hypothetical protein ACREFP_14630 [Acetobacteraceae bacterium]
MPANDEKDTEADFRSALRRAGLVVSPERYAVMLAAYRDFQALLAILDLPPPSTDEPAAVFRLPEPAPR